MRTFIEWVAGIIAGVVLVGWFVGRTIVRQLRDSYDRDFN